MTDTKKSNTVAIDAPQYGEEWTPHNTNTFDPCRAIGFAAAGAITVVYPDGTEHTIPSGVLAPGVQHVMTIIGVKATGTDHSAVSIWY